MKALFLHRVQPNPIPLRVLKMLHQGSAPFRLNLSRLLAPSLGDLLFYHVSNLYQSYITWPK